MKIRWLTLVLLSLFVVSGCVVQPTQQQVTPKETMPAIQQQITPIEITSVTQQQITPIEMTLVSQRQVTPKKITPAEALELMAGDGNVVILDVRMPEEYETQRIPESINLPLDDLSAKAETLLPDKNATLIVYCSSGHRSQPAAFELVKLGYRNVYDVGGIIDWPYETVSGK